MDGTGFAVIQFQKLYSRVDDVYRGAIALMSEETPISEETTTTETVEGATPESTESTTAAAAESATASVEEVTEAAKALVTALQRFAATQLKALPADVQKALEAAIADLKANADTVTVHVKDFEERLKAAWDILTGKKELPSSDGDN